MGFTAINTYAKGPGTASDASGGPDHNDATNPATVASEYLGRGEVRATAAPVAATSKKVATKGKKRAATTKEPSKTKRRKSSNVDDGLHVTKVRPLGKSDANINPSKTAPEQASQAIKAKKRSSAAPNKAQNDPHHVGDNNAEGMSSKAKPVSVYAHMTSMDALDSTSVRTTIDSVKANAGQSVTVYQDPSSSTAHSSTIELSPTRPNGTTGIQAKAGPKKGIAKNMSVKAKARAPAHVPTATAAAGPSSEDTRRSARARPEVDYTGQDIFITIDDDDELSDETSARHRSNTTRRRTRSWETIGAEDTFGDIDEDDILESAMAIDDAIVNRPASPPPRGRKQNMRDVEEHEDYGGALLTNDDLKLLAQIKIKESSKDSIDKPFVRKPFPSAIQDRSPLFGASNNILLRTCFRVGEALNTGSQAVRCNKNVVIELYARVTSSWRDPPPGRKQHFVFKDLYHDKPPHLEGVYELWNQAQLWDLDSKPFLKATEKGMMARAIARMKRDGQKWRLEVLSVYEATWEDVDHVAAVCNGDVQDDEDEDE